jgi:signal peptidase I
MTNRPTEATPDLSSNPGASTDSPVQDQPLTPTIETTPKASSRSLVREVIETLLLALLIFVAVRAVVLNFRVDGHSMDHSLQNNEMLLVNRNAYFAFDQDKWLGWIPGTSFDEDDTWRPFGTPERGDIIVLNPPSEEASADKPYIKRVIGLAGDTIEIRENSVFIDGIQIAEPYLDEGIAMPCGWRAEYCGPLEIPEGYVYVMGDNRDNSEDSRYFGLVPIENIIGKAWITYWPVGEVGVVPHFDYPELAETT